MVLLNINNLKSDHVPAFVVMELMYRGGDNWKDYTTFAFRNDSALTMAQISLWLDKYMPTEDILASNHGLPNVAPLDKITDDSDDADDHCFMELVSATVTDSDQEDYVYDDRLFSVIFQKTIDIKNSN